MDTLKSALIIAGAIVLAILAWKVLMFVTGVVMMLLTVAIFAAIVYVVFLVARAALRGRRSEV